MTGTATCSTKLFLQPDDRRWRDGESRRTGNQGFLYGIHVPRGYFVALGHAEIAAACTLPSPLLPVCRPHLDLGAPAR